MENKEKLVGRLSKTKLHEKPNQTQHQHDRERNQHQDRRRHHHDQDTNATKKEMLPKKKQDCPRH